MTGLPSIFCAPGSSLLSETVRYPLITSIAYLLGAEIAFLVGTLSDNTFAPFWPPNMVLFCALLGSRYSDWWILLLAVLPAHVVAELQVGMAWPQLTIAFLSNCAFAVLSAWGVKWLLVAPPWLSSFRRALVFVVVAAGIAPAIVALFGAYVRIYGGGNIADYWKFFVQWSMANALGNLTLAPVFLAFNSADVGRPSQTGPSTRWFEGVVVSLGLMVSCVIAIKISLSWGGMSFLPTLLYLSVPFVFWATVRFGVRGACLAVLALTLSSIWFNLSGPTVIPASTAEANVLALQLFLAGIAAPVLLIGAHIDSNRRTAHRHSELTQKVLWSREQNMREIAGYLHEGVCQDLAAAYLRARQLSASLPPEAKAEAAAVEKGILDAIRTLRTAAYGMYPPLLVEGGLEPALRSFVREFSERTGIVVSLDLADDIGRLAPDAENVAFRIIEEALTNVELHSGSTTARVTLARGGTSDEKLVLRIANPAPSERHKASALPWLKSFPSTSIFGGLGIAAMNERVRTIGGRMNIRSIGSSTVVEAVFPEAPSAPSKLGATMAPQSYCGSHTVRAQR